MTKSLSNSIAYLLVCSGGLGLLVSLVVAVGCDGRPVTVPADLHAQELRHGEQDAAERAAAAEADAVALMRQGRDKEAKAKLDESRMLRALQTQRGELAADAEKRAKGERVEVELAAQRAAAAADRRRVWWISALGVAASVGAAVLLSRFLPIRYALGIPGAAAASCVALAFWATWGAWILGAIGVLVLLAAAYVLALVLRWAIDEWRIQADHSAEPGSAERQALDKASRARQPALVRWFLDQVFGHVPHPTELPPAPPAAPEVDATPEKSSGFGRFAAILTGSRATA